MRTLITPEIFHDQPLEPQRPEDEAFFRFEDYANTLARLIAARQTRTPLVIGERLRPLPDGVVQRPCWGGSSTAAPSVWRANSFLSALTPLSVSAMLPACDNPNRPRGNHVTLHRNPNCS